MEALTISALLLLALVPSLFAAWRSVLVACGCYLALLLFGFVSVLWHFGATSEEGPAFAGLVILFGLVVFILLSSCAIRLVIGMAMSNLTQPNAVRLRRVLMGSGVAAAGLAALGILEFSVHRGFAIMVGSASAWLFIVAWLTPINAFKSMPFRDAA